MNTVLFLALGIMFVMIIVCFTLIMINSSKINTLLDYSDEGDVIGALKEYYNKIDDLSKTVSDNSDAVLLSRISGCENELMISLKKIGLVSFDAFDDVKGNLSFALAILDNNNDGIILTSLYGRSASNTYVREIKNGASSIKLLDEEKEALLKAVNKFNSK